MWAVLVQAQVVHILAKFIHLAAGRGEAGFVAHVIAQLFCQSSGGLSGPAEQAPGAVIQLLGQLRAGNRFQYGAPVDVQLTGQLLQFQQQFIIMFLMETL